MNKFDGVANTLFVPLVARINISKKFPEYFMDEKALELEKYLPQGADKGSSEYSNMASVARYYNMDKTVTAFAKSYAESNIVSIRDAAWNVKKAGKGQNKPGLLLCASGLYTLHDVLQKNDWNEHEIENRAEWLLANAQNIWKI